MRPESPSSEAGSPHVDESFSRAAGTTLKPLVNEAVETFSSHTGVTAGDAGSSLPGLVRSKASGNYC